MTFIIKNGFVLLLLFSSSPWIARTHADEIRQPRTKSCESVVGPQSTHLQYTKGPHDHGQPESYFFHPDNWVDSRRLIHEKWISQSMAEIRKLSEVIRKNGDGKPKLILTRGNSGSGKTWFLKNGQHPAIEKLKLKAHLEGSELGIVNPDTFKKMIQDLDATGETNSHLSHEEGSILAKVVIERALNEGLSLIVDKRFLTLDSIEKIAGNFKDRGYEVMLFDCEAPIENSLVRILGRPVGGESPNLPYAPIREGFSDARKHRSSIAASETIDTYISVISGNIIAERTIGQSLVIHDQSVWENITEEPTKEEMSLNELVYGDLFNLLSEALPSDFLKPFDADIDRLPPTPIIDQQEIFANHPEAMAIRYHYYYVRKHGDTQEHEKLAMELMKFFNRVYPNEELSLEVVPEQENRTADYRITMKSDNVELLRRFMHDSFWKPTIKFDDLNSKISIIFSTRRIGVRPAYVPFVEYEDAEITMPGESPPDFALAAKHFVFLSLKLGRYPEPPPDVRLIRPDIPGYAGMAFSTDFASAHHMRGFHAKQLLAAVVAAQVEHVLWKRNPEGGKEKLNEALVEAFQYWAWLQITADGQSPILRLEGSSQALKDIVLWLEEMNEVIQALIKSADITLDIGIGN